MHAVVPRGGCEDRRRVVNAGLQVVIGRERTDELPLLRIVRVTVLFHPARTGQELRVAPHVRQRDLGHDRSEKIRPHREGVRHEKTAVAPSHDAEAPG